MQLEKPGVMVLLDWMQNQTEEDNGSIF